MRTDEETIQHAELGHCVAREEPHPSEVAMGYVGQPRFVPEPTETQRRAGAWAERETTIAEAIKPRPGEPVDPCAACGYPKPSVRTHCFVCGAPR